MRKLFRFISPFIRKETFIILTLIVTTVLIYHYLITSPKTMILGDAPRFNGYISMIVKYSLKNYGQFGFWDQFISGGMSWISHPSGYHFSPVGWLTILLFDDPRLAGRFFELVYVILASCVFYSLLRVLGLSKITGLLISIPYIANEYAIVFSINGWMEEFMAFMLLPATVVFLWLGITRVNYWFMIFGAFVMSLNFFDNSYYVLHYNIITILWISFSLGVKLFWDSKRKTKKVIIKQLLPYFYLNFTFWIVFIGISAIKWIPLLEFRSLSARNYLPLSQIESSGEVMDFTFLVERFRNYLIPGTAASSLEQLGNNFVFAIIIFFVIYTLIKRTKIYLIFLTLLLLGIWGFLANRLPLDLYAFFYNFLPGFKSNMHPYRFFIIMNFAFFVCLALGFEIIIKQRRFSLFRYSGYFIGIIIFISSVSYALRIFGTPSPYINYDYKGELEKTRNIRVIKNINYDKPPEINGEIPDNLLLTLSHIAKEYKPEGKIRSTFIDSDNIINTLQAFYGELPIIHPPYDAVSPTYLYSVSASGYNYNLPSPENSKQLNLIKNQYKINSVLNIRFQIHQKEYSEYRGCRKLDVYDKKITDTVSYKKDVCEFLEQRISPIIVNNKGGIFYDKNVLPKVFLIPESVLIISDNRFNDYSGFIAKRLMFHPDFDEKKISLFSGGNSYLDDYTPEHLRKFKAVILVDPKIRKKPYTEKLIRDYQKAGGNILSLNSKYISYNSLHERSFSIWTEKNAWNYSKEDGDKLTTLFKSLSKFKDYTGRININKFTPEDLVFNVTTKKDNTVLQYSDSYFPGWKATINGERTFVYMADGMVKGIVIPDKGTHTVKLYYAPDSMRIGAIITLTTIMGLLITVLFKKIYHF